MQLIKITLQVPPPINQTYRAVFSSRLKRTVFFSSYPAKKWKTQTQKQLLQAYNEKIYENPVSVIIKLFLPNRRRDIDSGIKLILDALQKTIIKDDNQIERLYIEKNIDKEDPHLELQMFKI